MSEPQTNTADLGELVALLRDYANRLEPTICNQAADALTALSAERDALKADVSTYAEASSGALTELEALKARVGEVLEPISTFAKALDAKPLRGVDDEFYGIHTGTEWQASLRFSDFRRAAELHATLTGDRT